MYRFTRSPYIGNRLQDAFRGFSRMPDPMALPAKWYLICLSEKAEDFLTIGKVSMLRREENFISRNLPEERIVWTVGAAESREEAREILVALLEDCYRHFGMNGSTADFKRYLLEEKQ